MLKELRPGSRVGLVSISPGILRAAEVILHSMRGNELLLMTATPMWAAACWHCCVPSHVLCDRPSLPLVEHSLRQNRAQLMRMPRCTARRATSAPIPSSVPQGDRPATPAAAS